MSTSLWAMTGADLSAALAHPAPAPKAIVAYPGASTSLQPILATIANLSRRDQSALMRAFRSAELSAKPKRSTGGNTYRGWEDFTPALDAARLRAIEAFGRQWYLNQDMCVKARVPTAWASCKLSRGRSSNSARDMNFPTAQFWPGGLLPSGPDYAEPHAIDPTADIRTIGPAREFARKQSQAVWLAAMAAPPAPEFALEQTPEDIDAREMEPV